MPTRKPQKVHGDKEVGHVLVFLHQGVGEIVADVAEGDVDAGDGKRQEQHDGEQQPGLAVPPQPVPEGGEDQRRTGQEGQHDQPRARAQRAGDQRCHAGGDVLGHRRSEVADRQRDPGHDDREQREQSDQQPAHEQQRRPPAAADVREEVGLRNLDETSPECPLAGIHVRCPWIEMRSTRRITAAGAIRWPAQRTEAPAAGARSAGRRSSRRKRRRGRGKRRGSRPRGPRSWPRFR